jgi:hypothetical protein
MAGEVVMRVGEQGADLEQQVAGPVGSVNGLRVKGCAE